MAKVTELALEAARMKSWPQQQVGGDLKIEIPTSAGRSQVVVVSQGTDGDGDSVGFIWSKAADLGHQDPWALLRLNAQLTYARIAVRDQDIVVVHGIFDATASLAEVGKSLFYTAKAADELEVSLTGAVDRL
ncbi:MAG: hypothetical protein NT062_34260 [Proteobacteria bacterium]|nr:hypothetical protein [Pseudomonadota bacterium]